MVVLAALPKLRAAACAYLRAGLDELPVLDGQLMELALHLRLLLGSSNQLVLQLLQHRRHHEHICLQFKTFSAVQLHAGAQLSHACTLRMSA
jgi:hypothetical protein